MTRILPIALGVSLWLPGAAQACGGFFCNTSSPVDQTAEEVLFAVDPDRNETTMHVKIQYEGPADEFAWVVPVAQVPQLGVGTEALFAALRGYGARWDLETTEFGNCYGGYDYSYAASAGGTGTGTGGGGPSTSTGGGVNVIESGIVGPYETVILQANSSTELITWLQNNGYDLPGSLDPLLAPYVANNSAFVALKLAKDNDTGDLAPLVMTYSGNTPTIPIQLTSIAATPDMRLRVYLLGAARAVPDSYLHVQLNHMAVDWWTGGSNFEQVVSMAADEAGGHAFATDFSGSPSLINTGLYNPSWDAAALASSADAFEFLVNVQEGGFPPDDNLRQVLNIHVPVPDGLNISDTDLYNCPWCYESELRAAPFNAQAAADDMELLLVAPRRDAQEMLDTYPWMTRLTSSVSPVEMTVDPVFVYNPDLPALDQTRVATQTYMCGDGNDTWDSNRHFRIADGRSVSLPSQNRLNQLGMTEIEYLADLAEPYAAVIERTSASGQPEILVDNRPDLSAATDAFNGANGATGMESKGGCGCATGPSPASGGLVFVGLAGLLARRRRA